MSLEEDLYRAQVERDEHRQELYNAEAYQAQLRALGDVPDDVIEGVIERRGAYHQAERKVALILEQIKRTAPTEAELRGEVAALHRAHAATMLPSSTAETHKTYRAAVQRVIDLGSRIR